MIVFQTTFSLDSYKGLLDSIDDGTNVSLNFKGGPRVTKFNLWFQYLLNFAAQEDNLNILFEAYNSSRKAVLSLTGFNYDLREFDDNLMLNP